MKLAVRGAQSDSTGGKWPAIAIRYTFALAMVALAMLVRQWLVSSFGPLPTFVIFYPAVLLVASLAGGGPGVMATILSVLAADYWYFLPIGRFGINSPNDALALCLFCGASLFLSLLAERLRRSRWAEAVSVRQSQVRCPLQRTVSGISVSVSKSSQKMIQQFLDTRMNLLRPCSTY
jgi:K+-sensing histidine kinase KdpD